jgi:hypothetical protein
MIANVNCGPTGNSHSSKLFIECDGPGCKTCPDIKIAQSIFTSTVTGKVYDVINQTKKPISCKNNNVLVVLTIKLIR